MGNVKMHNAKMGNLKMRIAKMGNVKMGPNYFHYKTSSLTL